MGASFPSFPQHRREIRRQPGWQHRWIPPANSKRGSIDARHRSECGSTYPNCDVELPPWCPRGGEQRLGNWGRAFLGDFLLQNQVSPRRAALCIVKQLTKQGRRHGERWVSDHTIWLAREHEPFDVTVDDLEATPLILRQLTSKGPQRLHPRMVSFDRDNNSPLRKQSSAQRAGTRSEINDELTGLNIKGIDKIPDDPTVNKKVLPQLATSNIAWGAPIGPGHGPSSLSLPL